MIIIFYTTQPEICHIIAEKLPQHSCYIFTRQDLVYNAVSNMINPPDLLVLDYLVYNHNQFNVYDFMFANKRPIPLIFYNDPCIIAPTRTQYWLHFLESFYPDNMDFSSEELKNALKVIESTIESNELRPYIKLMQQPTPIPEYMRHSSYFGHVIETNSPNIIYEFKAESNMPNNLFYLLQILFEYKDNTITFEDLQNRYSKHYRKISTASLKVHISQLRTLIKKYEKYNFVIINKLDGIEFRIY
ncbi:MAG: hypothetical protein K6A43_05830 [Treponema sp.]|nr:hypothetical protein [Treponema sp.]